MPGRADTFEFDHVCLGGTFSPLHRGHRALLLTALSLGRSVFIGVTEGELAQGKRTRTVPSADERIEQVQAVLAAVGVAERAEVAPINEPFGRALEPRFEAIVVSEETAPTAARINEARAEQGLAALEVRVVPFELGLDGLPVNGTRVAAGEIDPEGVEPKRVHLAVGSENPVKVEAARRAFGRFVPDVRAEGVAVASGVPEQPFDDEGPEGAIARASAALKACPEAGLGVGIEAALETENPTGETLDVQTCAVVDRQGRVTLGQGPGFAYPPAVLAAIEEGESVGEAIGALARNQAIGREEGAIGFLTRGGVDRTELSEWAVLMALVPRLQPRLYTPLPYEGHHKL